MFGPARVSSDEGQIHIRFHRSGKFHFCLFTSFFQPLKGHFVRPQINPLIFFEFISEVINNPKIKIFAAKMRIPVCGFDFKHPFTDFQYGDIKCAAPEVEYGNLFFGFLIQTIRKGCRGRLVDNP